MISASDLNAAVQTAREMPRVRFESGLGDSADNWLRKKHAGGNVHEPATLGALLACQANLDCRSVYDVGALYGYFTLFAAAIWDDPELTAFEMHPVVFPTLRMNVGPWAQCVNAIVTDRTAPDQMVWVSGMNIFEEPENGGWNKLPEVPGAMKQRGPDNSGRGFIKADFITLDWYCEMRRPPDVIKIDVEGYQAKAVLGGLKTISQHKPVIIIELHDPEKIGRFNTTNALTVKPLFDLGYKAFWCGNFRDDATFEEVSEMRPEHERLSLMVFA
jgi:FkbM family methyltransferase